MCCTCIVRSSIVLYTAVQIRQHACVHERARTHTRAHTHSCGQLVLQGSDRQEAM